MSERRIHDFACVLCEKAQYQVQAKLRAEGYAAGPLKFADAVKRGLHYYVPIPAVEGDIGYVIPDCGHTSLRPIARMEAKTIMNNCDCPSCLNKYRRDAKRSKKAKTASPDWLENT